MSSVLLHNIRSLYNIGAMFRTSDAAGVSKIYLTGYSATPPSSQISKTALGAEQSVPWEFFENPVPCIQKLKQQGVQILALETLSGAKDIFRFQAEKNFCLMVGNEVEGLAPELIELADAVLRIPMRGIKESLNASTAYGIAVYQLIQNESKHKTDSSFSGPGNLHEPKRVF